MLVFTNVPSVWIGDQLDMKALRDIFGAPEPLRQHVG